MLFFRKFRERRAMRRKERQDGIQKVCDVLKKRNKNNVFRSERINIDETPRNMPTMDPTEDEDDASMTSSVYMRLLNPPNSTSTPEVISEGGAVFDIGEFTGQRDLKAQFEELQVQHEAAICEKNEELLACQVGFGFAKEDAERLAADLHLANVQIHLQGGELKQVKAKLDDTENKLNETITELDESKETLAATSALLTQAEKTIEEKDQEIFDLGKALEQGKRGAKVVLGLLTLGALCTDDR